MSKYIYCYSLARAHTLAPCSLRRPRCVSHLCYPFIRLLPTCISGELCAQERSEKRIAHLLFLFLSFALSSSSPIFLPLRFIAHARARVYTCATSLRACSGTHLHFGKSNMRVLGDTDVPARNKVTA